MVAYQKKSAQDYRQHCKMKEADMKQHMALRAISMQILSVLLSIVCLTMLLPSDTLAADKGPKKGIASHDLVFMSAGELAQKIRSRQVTSLEVVDAYLAQIAKYNGKLNAIVTLDKDGARQRAKEADRALAQGIIWGPLHGVPITIKDNIAVAGMKTTSSLPALAHYMPAADAPVVERLRKAGAIIMGKTNLPVFAMDLQTNSPVFGLTNNPWDLARTPGGSSGGAAAAVAAGLSALEIGNDLGGSIRIPSHFCGIYGLKPTEYMVPKGGIFPGFPLPDMPKPDFVSWRYLVYQGPIARSIDDLKLALTIIAGPDPNEIAVPFVNLTEPPKKELKNLRVAWTDDFGGVPVTAETRTAMKNLADKLARQGCKVEKLNPPGFDYPLAWRTFSEILDLQTGPSTPWYGRILQYVFGRSYRKASGSQMVIPQTYEKFLRAVTRKEKLTSNLEKFLLPYDAFICPVSTGPAFRHIKPDGYVPPLQLPYYTKPLLVDNQPLNYMIANCAYTIVFNLTGNPVVVIPIGYSKEGLPIGVQIVGKHWRDMELLSVAKTIDGVSGAFRHPPGY
jgi:amidase